jgi:hypothetical protein
MSKVLKSRSQAAIEFIVVLDVVQFQSYGEYSSTSSTLEQLHECISVHPFRLFTMAAASYDTGPNGQTEKLSAPGQTTQPDSDASSSPSFRELSHRTNAWELLWKEISWRFAFAVIWSVILIVTLYAFAEMGNLSSWQKRWFNMISILFSALISLILGSLLGLLGSTMRWPLLARNPNSPLDVSCPPHREKEREIFVLTYDGWRST